MVRSARPTSKRVRGEDRAVAAVLTADEARALFDEHARRYLQMSGQTFIEAWNRGDYNFDPDFSPEVGHLWMMLPFGLAR
jgi:hypothetical protein